LYYYSSKKKARENNVTSCDIISLRVNDVTSGHVTSGHMTPGNVISGDVTSSSTPFPNYDGLLVHHHRNVTSLQNESGLSKYMMVHEYQSFLILLFE
jgi:hypothetical protein